MTGARFAAACAMALVASFAACVGAPQAQNAATGPQPTEREQMPEPYTGPLTGKESVAWLQPVAAGTKIAEFSFFVHVDGQKRPLPNAECRPMHGSRHHLCQAPLPEIAPGKHTLRFSAVRLVDGKEKASSLSEPVEVTRSLGRGVS